MMNEDKIRPHNVMLTPESFSSPDVVYLSTY